MLGEMSGSLKQGKYPSAPSTEAETVRVALGNLGQLTDPSNMAAANTCSILVGCHARISSWQASALDFEFGNPGLSTSNF